ncbi:MarR family winged helix-turn-helix transcriptional regulator [Rhizobium sp. Leaf341]|uniref:MarR family winged helix-turn-helix transcriptional regulator n=1 Tax=Rhizobium sp. Leaf341 TaxID=1736344 RepID=UPI0007140907|nr:MarR family winged helix-turn-helix transcriptional regulator [Rhizobium sp. Leaf341]KQR67851.1 hypothetical protein ASG03_10045 [Rhizobium sp. Leaf341]
MTTDTTKLRHLIQTLQRFNQLDPKMQVSTILVLLEIASADAAKADIAPQDLEKRTGLLSGTMTRNIYYWEKGHADVSGAHDMVTVSINPQDRRKRSLSLTNKGRAFVNQIIGVLSDGKTERQPVAS